MSTQAAEGSLSQVPLFEGISSQDLATLGKLLQRRRFPPHTPIITAEQPGEVVYIILSGTVKVHALRGDGTDVIVAILRAGEVVGEMSVVDALGRSADVTTMEESTLLWVDRATFWAFLRTMPAITYNLVRILSRRLRLANARIEALAALDVPGRVACAILSLAREFGEPTPAGILIPFYLSQNEVAGLIGASRVRVNQVLASYKRCSYIATDERARFLVCDAAGLERQCR